MQQRGRWALENSRWPLEGAGKLPFWENHTANLGVVRLPKVRKKEQGKKKQRPEKDQAINSRYEL